MRILLAVLMLLAPAFACGADETDKAAEKAAVTEKAADSADKVSPEGEKPAEEPAAAPAEAEETPAPIAAPKRSRKLVEPYYAFQWNQGFVFPSVGDFFIGSTFGTSVGGHFLLNDQHSVFGIYDLRYKGPGLTSQEGRLFSERVIDHNLFAEHRWKLIPGHTFKARALYMKEMRRASSSEIFGNGLYDFWVLGGMLADDYQLNSRITLGLGVTYRYFQFPNYTDLLNEFESASLTSETSGSQQDYNNVRIEASGQMSGVGRAWLAYSLQSYINAKVIEATGVTGTKAQQDSQIELGASGLVKIPAFSESWPGRYYLTPSLRVYFKRSNQNFLRFKYFGDTSPTFVPDNYSYDFVDLALPLNWSFQSGWRILFETRWLSYAYGERPPRDEGGDYLWGRKQRNNTVLVGLYFSKQVSKFGHWTFGYQHHKQQSSNRFERFLPYNYTGHTVSTAFGIQY